MGCRISRQVLDDINVRRYYSVVIPKTMKSKLLSNIAPGEILDKEFLEPMRITQYRLARDIGVPPRRINEIVKGRRAITADTALRLGRYFGMSPEFWLNLQSHYDLEQEQERLGVRLDKEVKVLAAA
jgi:addiction module HigA family antidote